VLRWHSVAHGHTGILATGLLLLLEVLIVGHLLLLLVGHIAGVHAGTGHVALGRVDIAVSDILGGFGGHIAGIDSILVGSGVGSIQTSLDNRISIRRPEAFYLKRLTWIKFLPSALVTSGCSLGVVKV
jgi:hypothetical protein